MGIYRPVAGNHYKETKEEEAVVVVVVVADNPDRARIGQHIFLSASPAQPTRHSLLLELRLRSRHSGGFYAAPEPVQHPLALSLFFSANQPPPRPPLDRRLKPEDFS